MEEEVIVQKKKKSRRRRSGRRQWEDLVIPDIFVKDGFDERPGGLYGTGGLWDVVFGLFLIPKYGVFVK